MKIENFDFTWSPATGYPPLMIKFDSVVDVNYDTTTNIIIHDEPYVGLNFDWSFGDGTTSIEQHPVKIYNKSGNYSVTLKIDFGDSILSKTKRLTVYTQEKSVFDSFTVNTVQQPLYVFKSLSVDDGYVGVETRIYSGTSFNSTSPMFAFKNCSDAYFLSGGPDLIITGGTLTGSSSIQVKNTSIYNGVTKNGDSGRICAIQLGGTPSGTTMSFFASGTTSGFGYQFYRSTAVTYSEETVTCSNNNYNLNFNRNVVDWRRFRNYMNMSATPVANGVFGTLNGVDFSTGSTSIKIANVISGTWETTLLNQNISTRNSQYLGQHTYFDNDVVDTRNSSTIVYLDDNNSDFKNSESIFPGSVFMHLPFVLWHGQNSKPRFNSGSLAGKPSGGIYLFDATDQTKIDIKTGLSYRPLRTGIGSNYDVVGRYYYDAKVAIIDDPELAATFSINANRSWTYPPASLSLSNYHSSYSGWVGSGVAYYATYNVRDEQNTWNVGRNYFGRNDNLHCRYIAGPVMVNDGDNQLYSLGITIPKHEWYRKSWGLEGTGVSGVGYTARFVDLLIGTGDTESKAPTPGSWKVVQTLDVGYSSATGQILSAQSNQIIAYTGTTGGGGVYSAGSVYTLPTYIGGSIEEVCGAFGQENIFLGYMSGAYQTVSHKFVAFCSAANNEFNNSSNPTYTGGPTYISEVGLYNENNDLIMIGKLSKPVLKDTTKFLTIKMELDF